MSVKVVCTVISGYMILESAAGYYIGRVCADIYSDGDVCPQPYDNAMGYTRDINMAQTWYKSYEDDGEFIETTSDFDTRVKYRALRVRKVNT